MKGSYTAVTCSTLNLEIAVFTEMCSPRVLDQPVVFSTLSSITHNCDFMVKVVLAVRVICLFTAPVVVIDTVAIVSKISCLKV